MMCPDKELISAWHDGETGRRWSEEITMHITDCEDCAAEAGRLDSLSILLHESKIPGEKEIRDRVYNAIERRRAVGSSEAFWRRHIDISMPVLLSAAAMLIVFFAAVLFAFQRLEAVPEVVEEIQPEPEISLQVISLEDAAAILLSDDSGFDVLITIPSGDALSVTGEPQLIREADYRRGE
ncbi:MAG: hypothetical protein PQJ61_11840 [Spirochaetales bacterium]|uniref:Zinc-finger domain-containing protein n=1 Tax=Candidatus Thalassospirochaeta sargassi TaxID=3119039 RepID=A0AAJ1IHP5_9SPIO|nr:hypothetical protein [Spirochaetales bacterium]